VSEPSYSISWNRRLVSADESETITKGQAVILNEDRDGWLPATLANRTATGRRANGVALSDADATNRGFDVQVTGAVGDDIVDLGDGASGAVRVGDNGFLERAPTPAEDDDVVGRCDADGTVYLSPVSISTGSGDVTNGANVGTGAEVFKDKSGANLRFRKLKLGNDTSFVEGADDVAIRTSPPGWNNVKDYGATGDGVTDDTDAIQDALDDAAGTGNNGCTVYFPKGIYRTSRTLIINRRVELRGFAPHGGYAECVITTDAPHAGFIWEYDDGDGNGATGAMAVKLSFRASGFIVAPVWAALTAYDAGDRVMIAHDNRYHFRCTVAGTSGATIPVRFGTAKGAGHGLGEDPIEDGTCEWVVEVHTAMIVKTKIKVVDCDFGFWSNSAIHVQAGDDEYFGHLDIGGAAGYCNANNATFDNCTITSCGAGVFIRGNDTQRVVFRDCTILGIGTMFPGEGGFGYFNHSFLGAGLDNSLAEGCTGEGVVSDGIASHGSTVISQHAEACKELEINSPTLVVGGNIQLTNASTCTLIHGSIGCRNIWASDALSAKSLRIYFDLQGLTSCFGFRVSDDGGSNMYAWRYNAAGYADGYWTMMYGPQNPQAAFALTNPLADEGPGWMQLPYGVLLGYPSSDEALYFGTEQALRFLPLRGGLRRPGDTFRRITPVVDEWIERVISEEGYRAAPWTADTDYSEATPSLGIFASAVEPTAHDIWEPGGSYVWVCTTEGTSHATTEPTWPGAPTPGVTTVTDGTVVWTCLGQTPEWITTKYLTDGGGPP
jgi:hypothetical protein